MMEWLRIMKWSEITGENDKIVETMKWLIAMKRMSG